MLFFIGKSQPGFTKLRLLLAPSPDHVGKFAVDFLYTSCILGSVKNDKLNTRMIRATNGCVEEIERLNALMAENARLKGVEEEQVERIEKDTYSITIRLACARWSEQLSRENEILRAN